MDCDFKFCSSTSAHRILLDLGLKSRFRTRNNAWKFRSSASTQEIYCDLSFRSSASTQEHWLQVPQFRLRAQNFNINMNMLCNYVTNLPLVKHFSCYIFWSACLVFWSKQAKFILKIVKILLLMKQVYNAILKFCNFTWGKRALTSGAHNRLFRIMGKEICFPKLVWKWWQKRVG